MRSFCDGTNRRNFLRAGLLGGLGLGLADLLRLGAAADESAQGKSAIFIYLDGGQSHLDSWDMKPEGGDAAGEFKPIATSVPGLEVCEHMPRLATQADKCVVLRGVEDAIGVHGRGMRLVRSGNVPAASLVHPDLGSVITRERRSPVGVPPFVSLPIKATNSTNETPGYLGVAYRSFAVSGDPSADNFDVRALSTPGGMSPRRIEARRKLVDVLDGAYRETELENANIDGMDRFYAQAFDILRSEATRGAFDLSRERPEARDRYGRTGLGQACLLARRLVEVGVRCVTIDFGSWDTHQNNFSSLKDELLPPWDAAVAALLQDLQERGMLESTVVLSTGEMGRTPKINENAGRDHWGRAMSMMLAGGGLEGGQVLGRTDQEGGEVVEDGCTPADVAATILHLLGIDHHTEYHTPTGRPIQIVRDGEVIRKLLG